MYTVMNIMFFFFFNLENEESEAVKYGLYDSTELAIYLVKA